jgi:serine phosphatase RsbU (regulator of sigma subunit)/putative methionine-R-sulfoxide reductase with GAF domain
MTDPQAKVSSEHTELWRLEQLALISQVATQVTSITELDQLLVRVVGLIYQTFEFYAAALFILEDDRLILKAQAGPTGSFTVGDAFIPEGKEDMPIGEGIVGWVAAHQQELVAGDVEREQRYRYNHEFPETRAEIALPLQVEDRLLGVLDVQLNYVQAGGFDESDLLVLRALAGQVSMAIEDTRLYAEARRRGDYLASIRAVSGAIASILNVDRLLERVGSLIEEHFGYPCVQLFTVHYGRRHIEYRAGSPQCAELLDHQPQRLYPLDDPQSNIPAAVRAKEMILIDQADNPSGLLSELIIPLIYNDEVLGVLDVKSDRIDAFGPDDRKILEMLADNITIALRNANLYHSERWRRQIANSLRRISGALIADVSLDHMLSKILTELKRNLPTEILAIWLITNDQKDSSQMLQLSTVQAPQSFHLPADFVPGQDPWLAVGLEATEPLIRSSDQPVDPIANLLAYEPDHSAVLAPLRVQDRVLGLLTMAHREPGRYGREARAISSAFANQAAIAIENARLFRIAQEEAEIKSALLKVVEVTQGFGDLSRVLAAVVQIPPLVAEVDRCAIWRRQPQTDVFEPEAAFGFDPGQLEFFDHFPLTAEVTAVERLNQTRAPIVIVNTTDDQRLPPEMVAGLELETLVLLPIVAHDDMLGIMLVTFINPAAIRHERIRLITGVAHQAAVAIESKYLFDQKAEQERLTHELELARDIQTKLIPVDLPAIPGWELVAFWRSAQEVAGDFYDFIEVSPHQLGIVIADVAGKGMPAALYMTLTRSLLRATAPGQTDPRAVLTRVNQLLVPDTQGGRFVSVFYAILNIETGRLTYTNAGHNPPLLLRADGQSDRLHAPGLVLGVLSDIELGTGQDYLNSGDGIFLYTDGVTEVFGATEEMFGEERLKALVQEHWAEGPSAVVAAIQQAVRDFSATTLPSDDFTLLVLRRV